MYSKEYYATRKAELQGDYQKLVFEAYEDIERACIKKINKQRELEAKLKDLQTKEQESIKKDASRKTPKI